MLAATSVLADHDDRLNLYVRLARLMQQKIRTGEWQPGAQIPTLPALCREFNMSRPSVRQAIALLIRDGIVSSTRGRGTFVSDRLTSILDDSSLRISISDPLAMGTGQTIRIHARHEVANLPAEIATPGPQGFSYTVVSKTHGYRDRPFAVMRIYVAEQFFAKIPAGLDETQKIVPLLLQYSGTSPSRYRQEITIVHATEAVARALDVPVASAAVQIRRWWTDTAGRVCWATFGQYRSDMFVLDVTFDTSGGDTSGGRAGGGNLLSLISAGEAAPTKKGETRSP